MEVHTNPQTQIANESRPFRILYTVTSLSKYLAMGLFVVLPFFGGYVGYALAPQKVVEVERVVEVVKEVSTESTAQTSDELARVNEPIATTTIDMVSYQIRYTNNAVELLDGPNVVQTIPWDTTFRNVFTDDESLLITKYDINFDHYLDIGVLSQVGYGGVNRFYHFYTFNPQSYRLEKVADFETFENDISDAVNPSMDIAERTLTSSIKSGQEWRYVQYKYDGKRYVRSAEWSESFAERVDLESTEVLSHLQCVADSDCVLVTTDCEDCEFAAIARAHYDDFENEKRNQCKANPPVAMCDIVFTGEVRCINNTCRLSE